MSTLVIDEIRESKTLTQVIKQEKRDRIRLQAIRLWLINKACSIGDIKVTVKRSDNDQLIGDKTISIAQMNTEVSADVGELNPYWHGMITFEFDDALVLSRDLEFYIEINGVNGYTFTDNNYMGVVKPHDDFKNSKEDGIIDPFKNPFGFELWEYRP